MVGIEDLDTLKPEFRQGIHKPFQIVGRFE